MLLPESLLLDQHSRLADGLFAGRSCVLVEAIARSQEPDATSSPQPERVAYVEGIENPTEGSSNIVRWLVRAGYSDGDIAKVMGGNVLRVLEQVWH